MPASVSALPRRTIRPRGAVPARCAWPAASSRWARAGLLAALGVALALGGCLQDAHNADNNFNFNNANDPTATTATGIVIAGVDYASSTHTTYIVNASGVSQSMSGWVLRNSTAFSVSPTNTGYLFGAVTLGVGTFVRVHPVTGTDTPTDLYSGPGGPTSPTWSLNNTASLLDANGSTVSSCTVGSPIC